MKKTIISLLLITILMGFTGCINNNKSNGDTKSISNNTKAETNKQELVIKNSGWSMRQTDLSTYLSYGLEITNPNEKYLASFPKIKIVGRDDSNKILFSYDETLDYIYPKETLYYGDTIPLDDERPAKIEFTVNVSNDGWENASFVNYPKNTDFSVSNVSEYKDDDHTLRFTGEIENKSNIDIHSASIVVILKKEGNIVGGGYAYSDELNAKQNDTFEMYVSGYPEYDSYEISSHVAMIN